MKICAGIVLFHPSAERLCQSINAVLPQVDKLYLINNAPEDSAETLLPSLDARNSEKIAWTCNEENLGIAAALNQIISSAAADGYQWVLTLDQDSICQEKMAAALLEAANSQSNVAMASPCIIERGKVWEDSLNPAATTAAGNIGDTAAYGIDEVTHCITSGTLTNVKAVQNAGGFDERLFIDEVDRDMSIRLRRMGMRLIRVNNVKMHHEFGDKLVERKILFKTLEYRNYSPFRVYYQTRNMVYMVRKYGAEYKPHPIWRLIRPFFSFFVKFIFEPQRLARLDAFIRGYIAGATMEK